MPLDPASYRCWITVEHDLGPRRLRDDTAPILRIRGMKSEHRAIGHADPIAGHQAEHQSASGKTRAIDDDSLSGGAQRVVEQDVSGDISARAGQHADIGQTRRREQEAESDGGNKRMHQAIAGKAAQFNSAA